MAKLEQESISRKNEIKFNEKFFIADNQNNLFLQYFGTNLERTHLYQRRSRIQFFHSQFCICMKMTQTNLYSQIPQNKCLMQTRHTHRHPFIEYKFRYESNYFWFIE